MADYAKRTEVTISTMVRWWFDVLLMETTMEGEFGFVLGILRAAHRDGSFSSFKTAF